MWWEEASVLSLCKSLSGFFGFSCCDRIWWVFRFSPSQLALKDEGTEAKISSAFPSLITYRLLVLDVLCKCKFIWLPSYWMSDEDRCVWRENSSSQLFHSNWRTDERKLTEESDQWVGEHEEERKRDIFSNKNQAGEFRQKSHQNQDCESGRILPKRDCKEKREEGCTSFASFCIDMLDLMMGEETTTQTNVHVYLLSLACRLSAVEFVCIPNRSSP